VNDALNGAILGHAIPRSRVMRAFQALNNFLLGVFVNNLLKFNNIREPQLDLIPNLGQPIEISTGFLGLEVIRFDINSIRKTQIAGPKGRVTRMVYGLSRLRFGSIRGNFNPDRVEDNHSIMGNTLQISQDVVVKELLGLGTWGLGWKWEN
jgi:hypothetical protein